MYLSTVFLLTVKLCAFQATRGTETFCETYQSCSNTQSIKNNEDDINCVGFDTCTNTSLASATWTYCSGSKSCSNCSNITTNSGYQIYCYGYFSCSFADFLSSGDWMECSGANSCNNITSVSGKCPGYFFVYIYGKQSFMHNHFRSNISHSSHYESNLRSISIHSDSSFSMYNSSVISNGNDIYLFIRGYYAGYGLSVNCSNSLDTCVVFCYGNGCINVDLICISDNNVCTMICADDDDDSCQIDTKQSNPNYHMTYDSMVGVINDLFVQFNNSYSILPSTVDKINYNCSIKAWDYNQYSGVTIDYSYSNYSELGNDICCMSWYGCGYSNITNFNATSGSNDDALNLYCYGKTSCHALSIFQSSNYNVYGTAAYSLQGSLIDSANIVFCQGYKSCEQAAIVNTNLLICEGSASCYSAKITNVSVIIGLSYQSLAYANITIPTTNTLQNISLSKQSKQTQIYLISYDAGYLTNILTPRNSEFEFDFDNCVVYCQNGGCQNVITPLFCSESDNNGVTTCRLGTEGPTAQPTNFPSPPPTSRPTESNYEKSISGLIHFIENITVGLAVALIIICTILIPISIYKRKKIHRETMHHFQNLSSPSIAPSHMRQGVRVTHTDHDQDQDQDMHDNGDANDARIDSIDLSSNSISKGKFSGGEIDLREVSGPVSVNYVSGFGKHSSHLAIGLIALELYDVFIDIAFVINVDRLGFKMSFYIFLTSLIVSIIFNIVIVVKFLRNEFNTNPKFLTWFYERSTVITLLISLFTITGDVGMIVTVFTSQIFGNMIFYSPMRLDNVNMVRAYNFISILIEHIPQLAVQVYVIFYQSSQFSSIVVASLIVSIIDVLFGFIQALLWILVHKSNVLK